MGWSVVTVGQEHEGFEIEECAECNKALKDGDKVALNIHNESDYFAFCEDCAVTALQDEIDFLQDLQSTMKGGE